MEAIRRPSIHEITAAVRKSVPPPKPSILISGSRDGSTIRVNGASTHLAGTTLTTWFQLAGQATYTRGKTLVTVDPEGTFTWSRKANKRISVYVTHVDVKSNTVMIDARTSIR
jgi:hypothetical protein